MPMTLDEFSNEFDVLVASYKRFADFDRREPQDTIEFNEYEKSVFLTKAQEEIIKNYYLGTLPIGSFEENEALRRSLEGLVTQKEYTRSEMDVEPLLEDPKFQHITFNLPDNVFYIIYEQVSWDSDDQCLSIKVADVFPAKHDEFWRLRRNPFRGPNSNRVLRLDNGSNHVELVSNNTIGKYTIRYIRTPDPIILVDLPDETINNKSEKTDVTVCEVLHRDLLELAVQMALQSKNINYKQQKSKDSTDV